MTKHKPDNTLEVWGDFCGFFACINKISDLLILKIIIIGLG